MIFAIDFDGTCVMHEYPKIGNTLPFCISTLQELASAGHHLILFTMRSGKELQEAIQWFEDNNIKLWAVNVNPEQSNWTNSVKPYAHMYIDDAALGAPLITPLEGRPYVDWLTVRVTLGKLGCLSATSIKRLRKKPIVISGIQFTGNNIDQIKEFAGPIITPVAEFGKTDISEIYVSSLEGPMLAKISDWVLRGVAGEFYVCNNTILNQTYEILD